MFVCVVGEGTGGRFVELEEIWGRGREWVAIVPIRFANALIVTYILYGETEGYIPMIDTNLGLFGVITF